MSAREPGMLWYITVWLAGERRPVTTLATGLQRMCELDPMNMSARYGPEMVAISYWDEAAEASTAVAAADRLGHEAQTELGVASWCVVGLEIMERRTLRRVRGSGPPLNPPGSVRPWSQ